MKTVFIIMIGSIIGVSISMLINSIFGVSSLGGNLIKIALGIGLITFSTVYFKE